MSSDNQQSDDQHKERKLREAAERLFKRYFPRAAKGAADLLHRGKSRDDLFMDKIIEFLCWGGNSSKDSTKTFEENIEQNEKYFPLYLKQARARNWESVPEPNSEPLPSAPDESAEPGRTAKPRKTVVFISPEDADDEDFAGRDDRTARHSGKPILWNIFDRSPAQNELEEREANQRDSELWERICAKFLNNREIKFLRIIVIAKGQDGAIFEELRKNDPSIEDCAAERGKARTAKCRLLKKVKRLMESLRREDEE